MNKKKLLILIPAVALLLNGVGYLVMSKVRGTARSGRQTLEEEVGTRGSIQASGQVSSDRREDRHGLRDDSQPDPEKEETALARRAAGLAALEDGDYDKAFANFSEARALLGDRAHVGELLRVTNDLRNRPRSALRPHAPEPVRTMAVLRPSPRLSAGRRGTIREELSADASQGQGAVQQGLIVVTTNPRGLLVRVDETPIDLTPMRTKVRSGSHRVALFDGDRKVYETTLDVKEGGTATLQKDLPSEKGAEPSHAAPPIASPALAAADESPRAIAAPVSDPTPRPAPPPLTPPPGALATTTGTLEVSSPGLYGVVWINGRPRGYPPLAIGDLPTGPTKVEVRVNGIQKRTSTVVIQPGVTTSINLRSLSSQTALR
jgi:PEGA domain